MANYSHAGRFGEATRVEPMDSESFMAKLVSGPTAGTPQTFDDAALSPGHLRWGRQGGCDFVFGSPADWPDEYKCTESYSDGCTPDRRMQARCSLTSWGAPGEVRCGSRHGPHTRAVWRAWQRFAAPRAVVLFVVRVRRLHCPC